MFVTQIGVAHIVTCQNVMVFYKGKRGYVMEGVHVMLPMYVNAQIRHHGEVNIVSFQNVVEFYRIRQLWCVMVKEAAMLQMFVFVPFLLNGVAQTVIYQNVMEFWLI